MYRNILIPLDGSALAEQAIPYARALAGPSGSCLMLLRTAENRRPRPSSDTPQVDAVQEAQAYLSSIGERLAHAEAPVEEHMYRGDAAEAIREAVSKLGADVVAMASHSRSGLARAMYGSVAERLLARSPVPVLLVPARNRRSWPAYGHPVVVTLDGSLLAEAALQPALDLSWTLRLPLQLLRVVDPPDPSYLGYASPDYLPADVRALLGAAKAYLDAVASRLPHVAAGVTVQAAIGDPQRTLADLVARQRAAAVVMATHARAGISRLLAGSATINLIRQATMPVLVVTPMAGTTPHAEQPEHSLMTAADLT